MFNSIYIINKQFIIIVALIVVIINCLLIIYKPITRYILAWTLHKENLVKQNGIASKHLYHQRIAPYQVDNVWL